MGTDRRADAREFAGASVRSAALVVRGLRDLARDSNWLIKKFFRGALRGWRFRIRGLCARFRRSRGSAQRLVLFDIEMHVPTLALSVPGESAERVDNSVAAFAWSPGARYLVAAWRAWSSPATYFRSAGEDVAGYFR